MLNRAILIGRLTRDPDLRYTPAGVAVTQFTLAIDRPFSNQSGEREADFILIVTWRQQAETCAKYLRKGRLAAVEGRIQVRNYDNNEGKRIYVTEVIADNVRFLETNRDNSGTRDEMNGEYGSGVPMPTPTNHSQPRGESSNYTRVKDTNPFADDGKPVDISDDDLPF